MCSIGKIYIPDKHRGFWDLNYKEILIECGADYSVFMLLMAIGYTK